MLSPLLEIWILKSRTFFNQSFEPAQPGRVVMRDGEAKGNMEITELAPTEQ
jgi:hypothetical protein